MGKNKNKCWPCSQKHYPPTGKNCVFEKEKQDTEQAVVEVPSENDARESSSSKVVVKRKAVAPEKDSVVKKVYTAGHASCSDSEDESSMEEGGQLDMQQKILSELQKVSSRLQVVESQVASGQGHNRKIKDGQKLSTVKKCKKT